MRVRRRIYLEESVTRPTERRRSERIVRTARREFALFAAEMFGHPRGACARALGAGGVPVKKA